MKGKSSYLTDMPGIKHFCPSGKVTDLMRSRENYQPREEMLNGFIIFLLHDDSGVSFHFGGRCHVGRKSQRYAQHTCGCPMRTEGNDKKLEGKGEWSPAL